MKVLSLSLNIDDLQSYTLKQVNNIFPDAHPVSINDLAPFFGMAIERLEHCFGDIHLPYFNKEGNAYFNHLHGDHYAMFLYLLCNTVYKNGGNEQVASKIFLLNKLLHGVDAFYGIHLPEHFLFVHPIGTILGRGTYADYFVTYQGVTIGATTEGVYPTFSEQTILYSNASIIGDCKTGTNFVMAAKSSVVNTSIDHNRIVLGNYPNHRIIENKKSLIRNYFSI